MKHLLTLQQPMKHLLALAISILAIAPLSHARQSIVASTYTQQQRDTLAAQFRRQLSSVTSVDDSIKLLYNIFDVSSRNQQRKAALELRETSHRAQRYDVELDALRMIANLNTRNDSMLIVALNSARRLPDSDDQRETVAFISICRARYNNNHLSSDERLNTVAKSISRYNNNPPEDIFQEIQLLNEIAIYLSNSSAVDNINPYLNKALSLTDSIQSVSGALRNCTLTSMATLNMRERNSQMIVSANKKMLRLIESLENRYHRQGRIYKQYNTAKYTSLRRILSQYEQLDVAEVDSIYNQILYLAQIDKDLAATQHSQPSAEAFWLMKHGRYAEALPKLKQAYHSNPEAYMLEFYVTNILEAADKINDNATKLEYYPILISLLNEAIQLQGENKYQELAMLYNINHLQSQNSQLRDTYTADQKAIHARMILIMAIASGLLIIIIGFMIAIYVRKRGVSRKLEQVNAQLTAETENLLQAQQELIVARDQANQADVHKSEFINNMSHEILAPLNAVSEYSQLIVDCVDEDKQQYLQQFADRVKHNVDLVTDIVSDILEIGNLESPEMKITRRPVSINTLIETTLSACERNIRQGVELQLPDSAAGEALIITDAHRAEQVLINLMQNASKFTSEGFIRLDYVLDPETETITFSVTDSGIGIPKQKMTTIFERFEKLDPHTPGSGLGLSICATIAHLLNGKVWVDDTVDRGARFFFQIPIR